MLCGKSMLRALRKVSVLLAVISLPCLAGSAIDYDRDGDVDNADLARASQNPVADMISLPMKSKFNFGLGHEDAFAYELELQPVYPVNLGKWNLINRFITTIAYQEAPYESMNDMLDEGRLRLTTQRCDPPAPSPIVHTRQDVKNTMLLSRTRCCFQEHAARANSSGTFAAKEALRNPRGALSKHAASPRVKKTGCLGC